MFFVSLPIICKNKPMSDKIIKVGISHGDINGIGYELVIKTFEDARMFESCIPVLYGSSKILGYHRKAMDLPAVNTSIVNQAKEAGMNRLNIVNCVSEEVAVSFTSTPDNEKLAQLALERAVADLQSGAIDVLLTAPSNQDEIAYFEQTIEGKDKPLFVLTSDTLRIALATGKMPLSDVPSALTVESLTTQLKALKSVLVKDFMITLPRIAVLSFNPGMGIKEQQLGKEETEVIVPAIKAANEAGVYCFGPYAADEFFGTDEFMKFDAVLAMYHDQGLIPFRSISGDEGVGYVANLPYVITSPDQNVSYEKAGKNLASPDALRNALYLAIDIYHNRITDGKINRNPLRRQFFDRGSDNEKLDLTRDE